MDEAKERARQVWSTGDYTPFGRQLETASIALVESCGIGPGDSVLDVAAGDGNLALEAARRGARVTATDFSDLMITSGRARTEAARLDIDWRAADAEELPLPDDSFDYVTSAFGVMFAGDQALAASELFRTTRPGGLVATTAWTPDGTIGQMFAVMDGFLPPSEPDEPDPLLWGTEQGVAGLFPNADDLHFTTRNVTFSYESWAALRATHEAHGVWVVLKANMPPDRYEQLAEATDELLRGHNTASDGGVRYDAAYLEALIRKPA